MHQETDAEKEVLDLKRMQVIEKNSSLINMSKFSSMNIDFSSCLSRYNLLVVSLFSICAWTLLLSLEKTATWFYCRRWTNFLLCLGWMQWLDLLFESNLSRINRWWESCRYSTAQTWSRETVNSRSTWMAGYFIRTTTGREVSFRIISKSIVDLIRKKRIQLEVKISHSKPSVEVVWLNDVVWIEHEMMMVRVPHRQNQRKSVSMLYVRLHSYNNN